MRSPGQSARLQEPGNRTCPPIEMSEADFPANGDILFKEAVDDVIRIRRCSLLQENFQVGAVPYLHDITPVGGDNSGTMGSDVVSGIDTAMLFTAREDCT